MGKLSRFEDKAEQVVEGGRGSLEPVKLCKRAAKEMQREKMVGVGREYAPTLYNILVSDYDDQRMQGLFPSLAGEIETYLTAAADKQKLALDCPPLVRFIVDPGLKKGKFDVIAENVSPAIIDELRHEEMVHYGLDVQDAPQEELYSPTVSADEFDPFTPANMQSAIYVPEDSPAARQKPAPAPEPEFDGPAAAVPAAETQVVNRARAPRASLVNQNTSRRHELTGLRMTIGRGTDNDIIVSDAGASRHHAEIFQDGGSWVIADANSLNGTYLNNTVVHQAQLFDGDIIEMGNTVLEYQEG